MPYFLLRWALLLAVSGCVEKDKLDCDEVPRDERCPAPDASDDVGPDAEQSCREGCAGSRPHCDEASGLCVECRDSADCADGVCDETIHACVECLTDGECPSERAHCVSRSCVACAADGDCASPTAARCDIARHECVACERDAQCAHTGLAVCDEGECVACTVANETPCMGKSCNPATRTCTETTIGATGTCGACVADSECVVDHRCVPVPFQGMERGGFCLRRKGDTSCVRPYVVLLPAESLSGAAEERYCGIDTDVTSCGAINALLNSSEPCTDDDSCMADGALCRAVGGLDSHCTYACGGVDNCPSREPYSSCAPDSGWCGSVPP